MTSTRRPARGTAALLTLITLTLPCACSTGERMSRSELNQASTVHHGEILELREVEVEGKRSGKGTFFGFVLGSAVGSTFGSGGGARIAGAAGGVAGAAAGEAVEEASTRVMALEITVQLDNGEVLTVVQPIQADEPFDVGDTVRVLQRRDGSARVMQ